ncbi:AsnC family transcriptional regulator [Halapricum desulfuricans]|uniref:DNA-binding transcriptional regulator, Lrp family n=1 Tax=Halapricum desulfuricans TaxID=2841257 RepID=A0A897NBF6_9EURY|nr:AsnC family transcriptional regulator [Halapricum desulfuricans]QSG09992.1 DNA-binding transcriptional regulator, Lrp family [Halapricum desulfuricans]
MRQLDETDLEILSLLAADARRPYSEIGEEIGLSGPAVSDRVTRLQEAGIIRNFTIDVDRSELRAGVPVLIRLETTAIDRLRDRLREADPVEHVFVTAEGEVWFYARAEARNVRTWVESLLGEAEATYTVTLVEEAEWTPSIDGLEFALTCAECGNTVDAEGETARIDEEVYHFCCPSCLDRFRSRYQRLEESA